MEEKKIKVLITDDHPVVLEGLALMLKQSPVILVSGFARNETELLVKAKQLKPDVVMLDVLMPNSNALSCINGLKKLNARIGIVCCSSVTDGEMIVSLVNAGVNGYIMKSTSVNELQEALLKVSKGENYFSQEVTSIIVAAIRNQPGANRNANGVLDFSDRELEIIKLICMEKTLKEISASLNINIRTLESAKLRIMKKMGVKNVAAAVYFALKNKLVDVNQLNA
jgi:DNA-binding NarL/FixJ family response regulator